MKRRVLFIVASAVPIALLACATDVASNLYGDDFGPPGQRVDATSDAAPVESSKPETGSDSSSEPDAPANCTAVEALLAGSDTSLTAAARVNHGEWSVTPLTGAAKSIPSLVALGEGFIGATRGASNELLSLGYTTTFSAPSAVGSATTLDAPALAVVGAEAHLLYLSGGADSNKFFQTRGSTSSFGASSPIEYGGAPSFGPSGPAVAAAGSGLFFAQNGDDSGLYVQSWSSTWSQASAIVGAGAYKPAPPIMRSLTGAFDVILFYVDKDTRRISFTMHEPGNAAKPWTTPTPIHSLATTDERISVAVLDGNELLVAFRGQNGKAYFSHGSIGAASATFTPAVAFGPSLVDSSPAVAKGVCGDDAVAVFASSNAVHVATMTGGSWNAATALSGASGSRVAVATR